VIEALLKDVDDRQTELKATRSRFQSLAVRAAAQDPAASSSNCSILASN
jgi:hypothetical protein